MLALDTDFDGCMAIVQRLSQDEGIYLANSMNSLRLEGQKTVAIEIVQQLDWTIPDVVIIPGGNLGNVSALGAGFDMMGDLGLINRQPQIVVAQAEAANPLYLAYQRDWEFEPVGAKPTQASAIQIGNPVSVRKAIRTLRRHRGIVEQASEAELAEAAARADRTGMYNCPHTGVALAALIKLRERGQIDAGARVVVISTASGLKFTDFKLGYHERRLPDVASHLGERPRRAARRLRRGPARHRPALGRLRRPRRRTAQAARGLVGARRSRARDERARRSLTETLSSAGRGRGAAGVRAKIDAGIWPECPSTSTSAHGVGRTSSCWSARERLRRARPATPRRWRSACRRSRWAARPRRPRASRPAPAALAATRGAPAPVR